MTAFFFGDSARPLYGYYHAPAARAGGRPAVLLCAPFGEEAIRAFKPMKVLAERLARAGSPVLRFDYYGAGDSAGDCDVVSLTSMAADIGEAHEELLDMSLAPRAVWVGLRLGAAAALRAAADRPRALAGLLAWEPTADGGAYLTQMSATQKANLAANLGERAAEAVDSADALNEILGFTLSDGMRRDLEAFSAAELKAGLVRRLVLAPGVGTDAEALSAAFADTARSVDCLPASEDPPWNSDDALNSYSVPTLMINQIVDAIGAWR